jgi:hypothetical protein
VNTPGAYEQYLVTAYLEKAGLSKEEIQKVVFVAAPWNFLGLNSSSRRLDRRRLS